MNRFALWGAGAVLAGVIGSVALIGSISIIKPHAEIDFTALSLSND